MQGREHYHQVVKSALRCSHAQEKWEQVFEFDEVRNRLLPVVSKDFQDTYKQKTNNFLPEYTENSCPTCGLVRKQGCYFCETPAWQYLDNATIEMCSNKNVF